jgi:ankyrin repeat protein
MGNEVMVKLLLSKDNVNPDSIDYSAKRPLSWAARMGNEVVVKLVLSKDVELNSKDCQRRTPLSYAARRGREAVVKLLLARDRANSDSKSTNGWTPLAYAAEGRA